MRIDNLHAVLAGLLLACASTMSGGSVAQVFSAGFTGAPASIACTDTDVLLGPGASFTWNLPSPTTQIHVVETAGATPVLDLVMDLPGPGAVNTFALGPQIAPSFASTPFPYTFTLSVTPVIPGATTSAISFLCASATGSNFTIVNGGPFSTAIPTLDTWALVTLASLLAASFAVMFRSGFVPNRRRRRPSAEQQVRQ